MEDQRDILIRKMRTWIMEALRAVAKGKYLPNELVDRGFDLYEGANDPVSVFSSMGEEKFISRKDYNEMKDLYENQNKKIQAIKIMQTITDWGLKDAKEAVEDSRNFKQPACGY